MFSSNFMSMRIIPQHFHLQRYVIAVGLYSMLELLIRIGWDDGNSTSIYEDATGQRATVASWLHDTDFVLRVAENLGPSYADQVTLVDDLSGFPNEVPSVWHTEQNQRLVSLWEYITEPHLKTRLDPSWFLDCCAGRSSLQRCLSSDRHTGTIARAEPYKRLMADGIICLTFSLSLPSPRSNVHGPLCNYLWQTFTQKRYNCNPTSHILCRP